MVRRLRLLPLLLLRVPLLLPRRAIVLYLVCIVAPWAQAVTRHWPWTHHAATSANGSQRPSANGRLRPVDAPTLPVV